MLALAATVASAAVAAFCLSAVAAASAHRQQATTVVKVVQTPSGPVIATEAGKTLYVFVDDLLTNEASACIGDCANDWPPALVHGRLRVASNVTGHVSTVDRFGDGRQLTIDGRPLYTFSGDLPGELRGNGVGNVWWAMTPSGLSATSYAANPQTYGSPAATTLTVVQTKFGPVAANSRGQVLYEYTDDTPTHSACQAQWCLVDWPPLQTSASPTASKGITGALAVIDGAGGVRQVALAGHPLYTFAGDLHPGDVRGEGIGSDWYLLSPAGQIVAGRPRA